jgi:hypothetical protein
VLNRLKDDHLSPAEFDLVFTELLMRYNGGWIVENDDRPLGAIFAISMGEFSVLTDLQWWPWTTPRNKVEATVSFLNKVKNEFLLLFYSDMKSKRFFEYVALHGIIRKVGHIHDLYKDEPAVLFQSKAKK